MLILQDHLAKGAENFWMHETLAFIYPSSHVQRIRKMTFARLLMTAFLGIVLPHGACVAAPLEEQHQSRHVVVGYLPNYRVEQIRAERLRPVTDLVYFGIKVPPAGQLPGNPVEGDVLRKLKKLKSELDCRLLLCVGGWGRSEQFAAVCADDQQRSRLVKGLLQYCRSNGFDGVDYDWEHPEGQSQIDSYTQLLADTKQQFGPHRLLVTVALAGWQDIGRRGYDSIDRLHLMSYDHEFPHATMAKSIVDIERQTEQGCPARRIALGMPFYGRDKSGHAKGYAELARGQSEESDLVDGYALNGRATIVAKTRLAKRRKLAGVMIWELGLDAPDPQHSLLQAIGKQFEQ